jgi:streptogramin lyase
VFDHNGQWKTYQANGSRNGLIDDWVTAIFIDNQDRVWIGTERRGVSMLSPDGNWTSYNTPAWGRQSDLNYDDEEINAFAIDKQGRLWIGTWDALFALDSNGDWIAYTQTNSGFNPDYVKALAVDGKGRLWIATFHEVIVLDLPNGLPKPVPYGWINFRTKILAPIWTLSTVGEWLLAPSTTFMYLSLYFCSFSYIALLVLVILATIGVIWSTRQKNPKLLKISQLILILSTTGVFILCFLAFLVAMIPT